MTKSKKIELSEVKIPKGFVNLVINPDILIKFKNMCKEKGIREQHKEKEILENGMIDFIETNNMEV